MKDKNEVYTDYEKTAEPALESCYNWVFHFNGFVGLWFAIPRDLYNSYWNDSKTPGVMSSTSVETLRELIRKTEGNEAKLKQLVNEQ